MLSSTGFVLFHAASLLKLADTRVAWNCALYLTKSDRAETPPHYSSSSRNQLSTIKPIKTMHPTTSFLMALLFLQYLKSYPAVSARGDVSVRLGGSSTTPESSLKISYIALQAWKSAITDDPLGILNTWVGPDVCAYRGIFCTDPQNGDASTQQTPVVAAIDLNKASLQGVLVEHLSMLSNLSLIHLNSNRFSGPIPETLKALIFLQELDLSNNLFSGPFPKSTLLIPNLLFLDLRFNQFTGPIPEDIFNKPLDAIILNNNNFQGPIPSTLGISSASVINLANNNLTGEIPTTFGLLGGSNTSRLKEIMLLNNSLTGCVPKAIGVLAQVEVLDFSFNSLMGHLPDTISCLNEVQVLNFGHNKLSGEVPDSVCELKKLVNLTLAYNFLCGFDQNCGGKLLVRGFNLLGNCIPGQVMQRSGQQCSSVVHGGGLNCMRRMLPVLDQQFVCGNVTP